MIRAVTIECTHNPESLQWILKNLSILLTVATFYMSRYLKGRLLQRAWLCPILQEFNPQCPYDGLVNLGTTVMKRQGLSKTAPAITVAEDEAVGHVSVVNVKIHSINQAVQCH